MSLRVLDPGLYSLLVDFGRPWSRRLGVPIGGAADQYSMALGNALVGNPPDTTALEINLAGPVLEADCQAACVVAGAAFDLRSNRGRRRPGKTFTFECGETLHIAGAAKGMRAYLCVRGGFSSSLILGSRSAFEPVMAESVLQCTSSKIGGRYIDEAWHWLDDRCTLHVIDGPQASWFDPAAISEREFAVAGAANRMGIRLQGSPLPVPPWEMVSEPVCPGSVQVTNEGQCIILGVDGQTIGGYPKISQVISADLHKVGQLRAGDKVRFERVTLDEAYARNVELQSELHSWLLRLQTSGAIS